MLRRVKGQEPEWWSSGDESASNESQSQSEKPTLKELDRICYEGKTFWCEKTRKLDEFCKECHARQSEAQVALSQVREFSELLKMQAKTQELPVLLPAGSQL